jgi:hypothetical protein
MLSIEWLAGGVLGRVMGCMSRVGLREWGGLVFGSGGTWLLALIGVLCGVRLLRHLSLGVMLLRLRWVLLRVLLFVPWCRRWWDIAI